MDNSPDGDDTHSRASTLGGDDHEFQFPEKTPTMLRPLKPAKAADDEKPSLDHSSHVPGPLESQLAALMSKLIFIEQKNPTVSVTPDEYKAMSARVHALEAEKAAWTKRHEAIWALRDEDVDNNIKIRGLLAKTRRDLESMTALRDADLENLQIVRGKLCDSTRQLERLQTQNINGRTSPARGGRPGSIVMERRGTMDLFAAAKAAALEQRALELEQRNSDLLGQIETLKGGAKPDDLNRMTAHKAWKDTVSDLEARLKAKDSELARLRGTSVSSAVPLGGTAPEWHRIDAIHEEHASYREKVGGRMQALRSEKEALQREVHRKDDETHALEVKIQSLQRRLTAG
ncbi:hypothetical protein BDV95DRAFT_480872 [Massariosphaeria phaeospora]|uniref:Uncharacterized protein n=1 Tax=Massariosphaeria phaeospora TaxID=100035 RepID=A0A7C8MHN1_9PLEO|nr:hypothetical protein BDV95DRAFT_480872 [Massariosphaeria phaeospora]